MDFATLGMVRMFILYIFQAGNFFNAAVSTSRRNTNTNFLEEHGG